MGVHPRGFSRGDAEEMGVELIHLLQEAAPGGVHFARGGRVGVVKGVPIKALGWHLADGIHAVSEQPPERMRVVRAGKPAADADDGDRFGCCLLVMGNLGGSHRHVR